MHLSTPRGARPPRPGHNWRWLLALLLMTGLSPLSTTGASAQQSGPDRIVNVELILDLSGSMAQPISDDETRIDAAKRVLNEVIDALPESDAVNVGFRIYGHEGDNSNAGRAVSCDGTELVVPIDGVDKPALRDQVDAAAPIGWTPLALSLAAAEGDFPVASDTVLNNIVLLTDGEETCGGDPCDAAAAIRDGDRAIRTHVVGFALTNEQSAAIDCIAQEGEGLNLRAADAGELSEALFSVLAEIDVVEQFGILELEAFGDLFPAATASYLPGENDAARPPVLLQTTNQVEVLVGDYIVSWVNPSGESSQIAVSVEPDARTLIRGSLLRLPQGGPEVYAIVDGDGVTIWRGELELGIIVWVLPGVYTLAPDAAAPDATLVAAQLRTFPGTVTGFEIWTAP